MNNHTIEKLKELSSLYFIVKEKLILAETICEKFPVQPFNEIRNSYDHVMRAVRDGNFDEAEYAESRAHLKRAALDALELIAFTWLDKYNKIYADIDVKSMVAVNDAFLTEVVMEIEKRRNALHVYRNKRDDHVDFDIILKYEVVVGELCQKIDEFRSYVPQIKTLQEKQAKINEEMHAKRFKYGIVLGIVMTSSLIALASLLLKLFNI